MPPVRDGATFRHVPIVDDDEIAKLPKPGDVLASKYRLSEIIGHGGMGVVFAGHHEALAQSVAIKFLRPRQTKDDESVRRFLREARASASLQSAHATRVFDIASTAEGIPFIVMERLRGENVDRVLETRGAFTVPDAVDCILQACDALAEAHTQGIVHRDLKPSNLFLLREPGGAIAIKVLDFGISKAISGDANRAETSLTGPNAVLGSPQYMAPEQVMARVVDGRTDIWALGAILFELLTLRAPFAADSVPHLYAMIVSSPHTSLRSLLPKAPAKLESVIARCLEKSAAERPADVGELALLLAPFGSPASAPLVARIRSRMQTSTPAPLPSNRSPLPSSKRPPRTGSALELAPTQPANAPKRSSLGALVGSTIAVVAVISAAIAVWRSTEDVPVTRAPSAAQSASQTRSQSPLETTEPPILQSPPSAPAPESSSARTTPPPSASPSGPSTPGGRVHDLRGIKLLP